LDPGSALTTGGAKELRGSLSSSERRDEGEGVKVGKEREKERKKNGRRREGKA